VSCDSVESHAKFKAKYGFPFMLLADVNSELCKAFGMNEKISRTTFLLGADGKVAHVWPKVSVAGHAEDVLSKV